MSRTVITFGTFDVFHVGHLRVLERAAALGDRLVVGVSADALNLRKKGRDAGLQRARAASRSWPRCGSVDEVFVEESLELKRDYVLEHARRRAGDGRRLGRPLRRALRRVRGRLPPAHARDLHDRHHRAHRRPLRLREDPGFGGGGL